MNEDQIKVKELPQMREKRYYYLPSSNIKALDEDKRTISGLASTPNSDRYKEIILPKAFGPSLKMYLGNPIFLANHWVINTFGMPLVIGKVTGLKITNAGLEFTAQMDDDEIANAWWDKFRKGFIRGISVGFIPIKWERKEIKREDGTTGSQLIYTEVELLEISAAPLQANRESLVAASMDGAGGLDDPGLIKKLAESLKVQVSETVLEHLVPSFRKLIDAGILEMSDDRDGYETDDFDKSLNEHAAGMRVFDVNSLKATLESMAANKGAS